MILSLESRLLRKRLLELSQNSGALHLAPAFSCLEIVDAVYRELMPRFGNFDFIISKGHGYLAQLVVLESLGKIQRESLETIGSNGSFYGGHPDRGQPGIVASTGSLGHGLGIAVGLSISKSIRKLTESITVVLISDGELQEGSTWESIINAPALKTENILLIVDNNDMQTVGRMTISHSNLYPIEDKLSQFGWDVETLDGHNSTKLNDFFNRLESDFGCVALVAKTVKGRGVSYMESNPIWHYRSPDKTEFESAMSELGF